VRVHEYTRVFVYFMHACVSYEGMHVSTAYTKWCQRECEAQSV